VLSDASDTPYALQQQRPCCSERAATTERENRRASLAAVPQPAWWSGGVGHHRTGGRRPVTAARHRPRQPRQSPLLVLAVRAERLWTTPVQPSRFHAPCF